MSDEITVVTIPSESAPEKIEPEIKEENGEWKILLGELKAKTESLETKQTELMESLSLLNAGVEDLGNNLMAIIQGLQTELSQRLEMVEMAEIAEELSESIPEPEVAEPEVAESVEAENPAPVRKRPALIV